MSYDFGDGEYWWTEDDLGPFLGVSQKKLRKWRQHKIGPLFIKNGKERVYPDSALDSWLRFYDCGSWCGELKW